MQDMAWLLLSVWQTGYVYYRLRCGGVEQLNKDVVFFYVIYYVYNKKVRNSYCL